MNRQRITMAGAASFLLIFGAGTLPAQVRVLDKSVHSEHGEMMQLCAKTCSDCQRACDQCASHCAHLLHAGKTEHIASLMSCQDCADACVAASKIVSRGGPATKQICQSCVEVCALCAVHCEKFPDDKHMKACAEECRKCEKSCRDMVKHHTE